MFTTQGFLAVCRIFWKEQVEHLALLPLLQENPTVVSLGFFQLTQEFFVGRKTDQVISPSLGPWQEQREGVIYLDGMT